MDEKFVDMRLHRLALGPYRLGKGARLISIDEPGLQYPGKGGLDVATFAYVGGRHFVEDQPLQPADAAAGLTSRPSFPSARRPAGS